MILIEIDYTNHKGKRGVRRILDPHMVYLPKSIYYPGVFYLIEAHDIGKNAPRTFNPANIHSWREVDSSGPSG
jgi:predicted DNA-binding transcriptional regulator YafY